MIITDVRIRKITDDEKMKAIVSVTFDNEFAVHDIKIIDGNNGLFIAMPSRKLGKGEFRDIAHPLTPETRAKIRDAIFEEYEKVLSELEDESEPDFSKFDQDPDEVYADEVSEESFISGSDSFDE